MSDMWRSLHVLRDGGATEEDKAKAMRNLEHIADTYKLHMPVPSTAEGLNTMEPHNKSTNPWQEAVLHECMRIESAYVEADPKQTLQNLINWYVKSEAQNQESPWFRVGGPAVKLTVAKSRAIEKGGYEIAGLIMHREGRIALSYQSAVRWLTVKELFNILHNELPSEETVLAMKYARDQTKAAGDRLKTFIIHMPGRWCGYLDDALNHVDQAHKRLESAIENTSEVALIDVVVIRHGNTNRITQVEYLAEALAHLKGNNVKLDLQLEYKQVTVAELESWAENADLG